MDFRNDRQKTDRISLLFRLHHRLVGKALAPRTIKGVHLPIV